jgi:MoaA/NifB/PqqE/SkfB family radical SAM enzyme
LLYAPASVSVRDIIGLTRDVGRGAFVDGRPFLLYLKPTARCDLRCEICNRWKQPSRPADEIPLAEIEEVLLKFRKAGCAIFTLWGGEPTLRRDLPEILAAARKLGYRTSMCTNCNSLWRKADRILPDLDVLLCSLDGLGEAHDELRGVRGLFRRVLRSIDEARRYPHVDIKIWATIHRRNVHDVDGFARLARDLGVAVEYFPVSAIGGYNSGILPTREDLRAAFERVRELKRMGYPIRNPDRVLDIMAEARPFSCNFGRIAIHLDHEGNVYSCEDPEGRPLFGWGHHSAFDPDRVFASSEWRRVSAGLSRCNACRLPCSVELAGSLPVALAGLFRRSVENML